MPHPAHVRLLFCFAAALLLQSSRPAAQTDPTPPIHPAIAQFLKDKPEEAKHASEWRMVTIDVDPDYLKTVREKMEKMDPFFKERYEVDPKIPFRGSVQFVTDTNSESTRRTENVEITKFPFTTFGKEREVYILGDIGYAQLWGSDVRRDEYDNPIFVLRDPKRKKPVAKGNPRSAT